MAIFTKLRRPALALYRDAQSFSFNFLEAQLCNTFSPGLALLLLR
jgi:hypothetical protein